MSALPREQRNAAIAAAALGATMLLPWYEKKLFVVGRGGVQSGSDNLTAFNVFSWVEAAVLLVSVGVLVLVYARYRKRPFHLPFGDGTVIMAAGVWTMFLLGWRFFDKPDADGQGTTIGINWGIFVALLVAAALAAAGYRLRLARIVEPPLPGEDYGWVEGGARRAERTAVTVPEGPRPHRRRSTAGSPFGERPPAWDDRDLPPAPGERRRRPVQPEDEPESPPPPDRLF